MASERRGRDDDPERMTRGARRGFAVLAALMLVVGLGSWGASVAYTHGAAARSDAQARTQAATIARLNAAVTQLRRQQLAQCGFAVHLGSVPLPGKPKPGKLGVQLLTDSRAQWRTLHCPGKLPPSSPGLRKWAAYYHLPQE